MKNRNVRYLTHEGIKNISTNRLMSIASVAVLTSCLVMIGFAVLLFLNIDSLLHNIESENIIMVFVEKGADEVVTKRVEGDLNNLENVSQVEFIPKAEAFKTVLESLGENKNILMNSDDSFLPDGFRVTVTDMNGFADTVESIRNIKNVLSIRENGDLASRLSRIRTAVGYVSIGVIVLLLLVSIFIIANTVKITMYTRRLEISIMKAVGATNSFIRWPFFIEGISIGFIAACCALLVLFLIYFFSGEALYTIFGVFGGQLVDFKDYVLYIFAAFLGISIVTGGIGSIVSISKYLKEQGSVEVNENT